MLFSLYKDRVADKLSKFTIYKWKVFIFLVKHRETILYINIRGFIINLYRLKTVWIIFIIILFLLI